MLVIEFLLLKSILLKVQMGADVIQLKESMGKCGMEKCISCQDKIVHDSLCPSLQQRMYCLET
jgi:hypothetical protein